MKDINITGTDYDITVQQLTDGTWCVFGWYGDCEIDSAWCDVELATFADADSAVLDVITNY